MKKVFSLVLVLLAILASTMLLASCEAPETPGAEIKVYLGDAIYDFDPTDYYTDSNADQVMNLIFEPLFYIDEDGDRECAAADDYDVDEKERLITIELRESYWSDGTQVKAEDFIYAWRDILLSPDRPNPASALLYDIEGALDVKQGKAGADFGAKASLYEITIKYREGANYEQLLNNLASLATSPIHQASVTDKNLTYWSKSSNTLVTNGPFKVTMLNYLTGEFVLERNIGYHQPLDTVDYDDNVVPYKLISFITTEGEEVDPTEILFTTDKSLDDRAANKDSAVAVDDLSTYSYLFNTKNPLFAKKYVRQALSIALDRDVMAQAIIFASPADGFLPNAVYQNNSASLISAKSKLAEALALLESVDFEGLEKAFTLTVNDDAESVAMAELAVATWQELGFTVTLNKVSDKDTVIKDFSTNSEMEIKDSELQVILKEAAYGNAEFDVIGLDWQMYSADAFVALAAFTTNMNGNGVDISGFDASVQLRPNVAGWSNETYDSYISAAFNATNSSVRDETLRKAEALLVDSAVIVPVVYNKSFAFVKENVDNVLTNGLGNFVFTEVEIDE